MFMIIRSAFWLTVAFMVIKPGMSLPDAGEVSAQAMAAGSQIIAEQIQNIECTSFECIGGKAIAAAAIAPHVPVAAAAEPAAPSKIAPVPYPRPDRA